MKRFIETTNPNGHWTIERVYRGMTDAELNELEASGQAVDNVHLYWGRAVAERIAAGVPAMYAYAAIAKKVGRGKSTIAQCYYTWKTFRDVELDERVPYSVLNHARQWEDPDEVIDYYLEQRCSVDEVEAVFRVREGEEERELFRQSNLPRFLVGAWREAWGLPREQYEQAIGKLNEFLEIVGYHGVQSA